MPKGPLWEAYLSVIQLSGNMFRMLVLPPGAPAEATDALRAAVRALADDKQFAEDATKAFGYVPSYITSPDLNSSMRAALTVPAEKKAFFAEYIEKVTQGKAGEVQK